MQAKVFWKDGSIECHTIPSLRGTSVASTTGNEVVQKSDVDERACLTERYYQDEEGIHLERGSLALKDDWHQSKYKNVIVPHNMLKSVSYILLDGMMVYPEQENPLLELEDTEAMMSALRAEITANL